MKLFGIEIKRSKTKGTDVQGLPDPSPHADSTTSAEKPVLMPLSWHLAKIYTRIDLCEKQIDKNRLDIQATSRAAYRNKGADVDIQKLMQLKESNTEQRAYKTGEPYEGK